MSDRDDTSAPTGSPAPSATAKRETGGETTKAPTTSAAERQRRHRKRRAAGVRVVRVEVPDSVVEALVKEGWLGPGETVDQERLADAIERLVDCWELATLLPEPVAVSTSTNL